MAFRDRTNEFKTTAMFMQGGMPSELTASKIRQNFCEMPELKMFILDAKSIATAIGCTFTKVETLGYFTKKQSIFDDKRPEGQQLTHTIKKEINHLNDQILGIRKREKYVSKLGGKHLQLHTSLMVVSLQSNLASISDSFKQILEGWTENLMSQNTRRGQYSQDPAIPPFPEMASNYPGNVLLTDQQTCSPTEDVVIDLQEMSDSKHQHQVVIQHEQNRYTEDRIESIRNIETTIVELGTIFQQLAEMVHKQEDMIQRIDSNLEDTDINITLAHSQLLKYFQSVLSNRWLALKVFVVLIVFFITFAVFFS